MIYINLYLYTNFNNCGFLVEKSDSESNRNLQAALGNTLEGLAVCQQRQNLCAFVAYVANHRWGKLANVKNLTNSGMDGDKNELHKLEKEMPIIININLTSFCKYSQ